MHLQPIFENVSVLWGSVSELFEMVCVCRLDPICPMRIGNLVQKYRFYKTFFIVLGLLNNQNSRISVL
jgi:hypothetical protein